MEDENLELVVYESLLGILEKYDDKEEDFGAAVEDIKTALDNIVEESYNPKDLSTIKQFLANAGL